MKIHCLIKPNKEHHQKWVGAFAHGLQNQMGDVFEIVTTQDAIGVVPLETDLVVFWSMHWSAVIAYCRKNHVPFLCLEKGYIDRDNFTSVNFNGLNGRSELKMSVNNLRAKKHNWNYSAPKEIGDKMIIMGQMPGDKTLEGEDIYEWAYRIYKKYENKKLNVFFKPHPLDRSETVHQMDIYEGSLEDVLKEAAIIITYSSNSAVDAWMNGVIATAHSPMSMIWKWQHKNQFDCIKSFINDISYRQYNLEEFESGEAWQMLKEKIRNSLHDSNVF